VPLAPIVVATILAHAAFNGCRLTLSLSALSQGASPLTVGTIMSLFAALPMLLGVPAGRMVDRVGVRGPIITAASALVFMVALPGVFPGIATLYITAAAVGTSFMVFHVCVQHAVGQGSQDHDRKGNFGWLALGFSISNFFGPMTAGVAIDTVGFDRTFLLLSIFAAASAGLLLSRRSSLSHTPRAQREDNPHSTMELLRDPHLLRVFLATGLLASAWDMFVFVMPIYGTSIGLSASTIGFILAAFASATFLVRILLPVIQRHVREWTMIAATMAVACVAYALFPVMHTVALLAAAAFLLGLGLGATQPSVLSLLYATAPAGRAAEAVGVRAVVLNASHTFLPLLFGGVGAALGMTPVFLTMSVALAGGSVLANRVRRGPA
jgi:predicted MFS family arabinose efflux permease